MSLLPSGKSGKKREEAKSAQPGTGKGKEHKQRAQREEDYEDPTDQQATISGPEASEIGKHLPKINNPLRNMLAGSHYATRYPPNWLLSSLHLR